EGQLAGGEQGGGVSILPDLRVLAHTAAPWPLRGLSLPIKGGKRVDFVAPRLKNPPPTEHPRRSPASWLSALRSMGSAASAVWSCDRSSNTGARTSRSSRSTTWDRRRPTPTCCATTASTAASRPR